ncbi:MAG: hypothetical protein KDB90_13350 [Planctomycetes bacterium]|nr:hypothetical protein [Planctomycetota bacterium]
MKIAWMVLIALMLATSCISPVRADEDEPNWKEKFPNYELLGERKVDFGGDKDTIEVTGKEGRFESVLIGVINGNLEMYDIKFTFGNGDDYSPEVRQTFKEGERSRQIDLPGEARVIRKVEFKYKSKLRKGKATVKLFGKPGEAGKDDKPDKPGPDKGDWKDHLPKSSEGYQLLGTRVVSFGTDRDTIEVTAAEGRFTAIVIGVADAELEMWDIKVDFRNDETLSPDVRANFDEKSRSRVIDLPGEARVIKKVTFFYKSKIRDGKATVKLYGKPAGVNDRYPGYSHLGSREVDFGKDKDVIIVGESKGKFTGFMLEVENADLELKNIVITFGNGKQHEVKTKLEFDEGSRTRQVDFPGDARTVERMVFEYSTKGIRDGKATVNVYGKEAK